MDRASVLSIYNSPLSFHSDYYRLFDSSFRSAPSFLDISISHAGSIDVWDLERQRVPTETTAKCVQKLLVSQMFHSAALSS